MEPLVWLPTHPDIRGALRDARRMEHAADRFAAALRLAGYNRDFLVTEQIHRLMERCALELGGWHLPNAPPPVRLAFLATHTVDHLVAATRVSAAQRGMSLAIRLGPYGLYRHLLLEDDPALGALAPQVIVLALDVADFSLGLPLDASAARVADAVSRRVDDLRVVWREARERYGSRVVQQSLVAATPPVFGAFDGLVSGSPGALVDSLNAAIRNAAREDGVLLLDLAAMSAKYPGAIGDRARWHQAKQIVAPQLAPLYGDTLARIVGAAMGSSKKCLVLDLDNTLWGGTIGDDGMDGIQLGQGSAAGEAYIDFQRYVALLAARGIVLAVCSKNTMEIAESGFEHPEMALKRQDIACFVANWHDKPQNLRVIARTLDLGIDSLVFVDDNPAERDIVRRELPEVAVPELPDDVACYAERIADAGYFEAASFTTDDMLRTVSYAANAHRRAELDSATDMDGYLRSLGMTLSANALRSVDLVRAVQLINKSNQFNLTTRRYTDGELTAMTADPRSLVLSLRLKDRFSDNGLISVIILRPAPAGGDTEMLVDTWLMSCRVLGRQVEVAALDVLSRECRRRGVSAIVGEYRPSSRNALVARHYPGLGFAAMSPPEGADLAATFWRLELSALPPQAPHFIEINTAL